MPTLSQIRGQDQAIETLRRAVAAGRLAQSYLFAGPAGVGKATAALALAAAINCHEAPGEGCQACESCTKLDRGLHPDLIRLAPDGRTIKIDQVRALESTLHFTPHEARSRLIIIDGADQLGESAANALLKSVEEPRPRTVFVLVSSAPHAVVPTLISRCQRIRFSPLPHDELLAVLAETCEAPEDERLAAAAVAQGSVRRALELLQGERIAELRAVVQRLWRAAEGRSVAAVFEEAGACGTDRLLLGEALELLRLRLRDVLLLREGLGEGRVHEPDEGVRRWAGALERRGILRRLRAVDEAQAALRGNVHARHALENLVLALQME